MYANRLSHAEQKQSDRYTAALASKACVSLSTATSRSEERGRTLDKLKRRLGAPEEAAGHARTFALPSTPSKPAFGKRLPLHCKILTSPASCDNARSEMDKGAIAPCTHLKPRSSCDSNSPDLANLRKTYLLPTLEIFLFTEKQDKITISDMVEGSE